jgi:hypothetical protein
MNHVNFDIPMAGMWRLSLMTQLFRDVVAQLVGDVVAQLLGDLISQLLGMGWLSLVML